MKKFNQIKNHSKKKQVGFANGFAISAPLSLAVLHEFFFSGSSKGSGDPRNMFIQLVVLF